MKMLYVIWRDEARDYIDEVPEEVLRDATHDSHQLTHKVWDVNNLGRYSEATASVSVLSGDIADLNYGGGFEAMNEKGGMYIGVMRVRFNGDEVTAQWKRKGAAHFDYGPVPVVLRQKEAEGLCKVMAAAAK